MTQHLSDGLTPNVRIQYLAHAGDHNNVYAHKYIFVDKNGKGEKAEQRVFSNIEIINKDKGSKDNLYIDDKRKLQRGYYKCTILDEETVVYLDKNLREIPSDRILTFHEMLKYTDASDIEKKGCYSAGDRYFTKDFRRIPSEKVEQPAKPRISITPKTKHEQLALFG